jgi:hypothetical protein
MAYTNDDVSHAHSSAAVSLGPARSLHLTWPRASKIALVILVAACVPFGLDSGISWDENLHHSYGRAIFDWFASGFTDPSATKHRSHLYGGLFDLAGHLVVSSGVLPWGRFEVHHVFTALIALLGVIACWKMATEIAGPRAGFLAATSLLLTPCWVGHGMFNPKDIPFASAAAFVAYSSVCIVLRRHPLRLRDALWTGLALGAALGVRPGGMFLALFPLFATALRFALDSGDRMRRRQPLELGTSLVKVAAGCAIGAGVAWFVMLSAWPWAQLHPFSRPFEAAEIAARYRHDFPVLFDGQFVLSTKLPRSYIFTWFAITLPEFYALACACALAALVIKLQRRQHSIPHATGVALLVAFVAMPLVGVLLKRPVLYDAQRHFLFLLPPAAALIGVGVDAFISTVANLHWRAAAFLCLGVAYAITLWDLAHLHPYEYVYFNRSFGGLPAAHDRFETDYWGTSYREGFAWVLANVTPRDGERIAVATCKQDFQLSYFLEDMPGAAERFRLARSESDAEIYLSFTRGPCRESAGTLLHRVVRQNTTLLSVFDRRLDNSLSQLQ